MTSFIPLNHPLTMLLVITLIALIALQSIHVFFCCFLARDTKNGGSHASIVHICYECAVLVFLTCSFMMIKNYDYSAARFLNIVFPLDGAFYISAIPLSVGLVYFAAEERSPRLAVEVALFAALLACTVTEQGSAYLGFLVATIGVLIYRTLVNVQEDEKLRRRELTRFSIIDAINLLPSGILCLSPEGRPLIMNQSMRACLIDLSLPTDLSDLGDTWRTLQSKALSIGVSNPYDERSLLLKIPNGSYYLFEFGTMQWENEALTTISATDVTEEAELNQLIERSNDLIEAASREIEESLADVQIVAQNEAILSLRSKVHDIIGQRLSILHRLIEDDDLSDESIAGIKPLLSNLLTDLRIDSFDSQTELDAIVSAFELIDVSLEIDGELPNNERIAQAFVTVIREATTNAVRHAQAHFIKIQLVNNSQMATMTIENEYMRDNESTRDDESMRDNESTRSGGLPYNNRPLKEGSGIPNMRKAIRAVGGTLDIRREHVFIVQATVPIPIDDESPTQEESQNYDERSKGLRPPNDSPTQEESQNYDERHQDT